jgi:N-acetylglucosamine-6-phosphate deacetylase
MKKALCVTGAEIVTPLGVIGEGALVARDGRIERLGRREAVPVPADAEVLDLPGRVVLPGMVDVHIHGLAGVDFDECDAAGFERAAATLLARGVTQALITLLVPPWEDCSARMARVRGYLERADRTPLFCGAHLEGPFLNPEMPGAIPQRNLWPGDVARADALFDMLGPWLKMMTVAPEVPGGIEIIRRAAARGIVASVGHSKASYETVGDAIDAGAAQVTHMFNVMPPAHHREPGVLGAAFTRPELRVQLIADGIHVHPVMLGLALRARGVDAAVLISDAVAVAGLPDGEYLFAGDRAIVSGGVARRANGALCGSTALADVGVRTLVARCGVSLCDAARMAALNPARSLGLDGRKGRLAPGCDADFVVMSRELTPELTVFGGRVVS